MAIDLPDWTSTIVHSQQTIVVNRPVASLATDVFTFIPPVGMMAIAIKLHPLGTWSILRVSEPTNNFVYLNTNPTTDGQGFYVVPVTPGDDVLGMRLTVKNNDNFNQWTYTALALFTPQAVLAQLATIPLSRLALFAATSTGMRYGTQTAPLAGTTMGRWAMWLGMWRCSRGG
jgi:hypothetical protein